MIDVYDNRAKSIFIEDSSLAKVEVYPEYIELFLESGYSITISMEDMVKIKEEIVREDLRKVSEEVKSEASR